MDDLALALRLARHPHEPRPEHDAALAFLRHPNLDYGRRRPAKLSWPKSSPRPGRPCIQQSLPLPRCAKPAFFHERFEFDSDTLTGLSLADMFLV